MPVSFSMLLNLVSASNSEDKDVLWGFIRNYDASMTPQNHPELDRLADYAVRYFHDLVRPHKAFRAPDARERAALEALDAALGRLPADADGQTIQDEVYRVGNEAGFDPLRDWFKALYQVLLGQDQGPRFGSFVALYGIEESRKLIAQGLARDA